MRSLVIALALSVAAPASAAFAYTETHHTSDNPKVQVVLDMVDAWNTQDWDRVVSMFAEDGSLHSMMVEPIVGHEALAARIGHLGAGIEQINLNVRNIGQVGDVVFIERVDEFVYNGHEGSVPVVGVIEINDDGSIQEWREYYDRAELLEAMGIRADFNSEAR